MAFAFLFLALWKFFSVNRSYHRQDTSENVNSSVLKPVLWHLFYFQNFGGVFESIEGTVAKIRAIMSIHGLLNRFCGFHCTIFSTLEVILCQSKALLLRYGKKRSFSGFETGFTSFAILFLALLGLFLVDRRQHCQDSGENVNSSALKPVLRHYLFYFSTLEVIFSQSKVHVPL